MTKPMYILLLEPCKPKQKHRFFMFQKSDNLDSHNTNLNELRSRLNLTNANELQSIILENDFFLTLQNWIFSTCASKLRLTKIRNDNFLKLPSELINGKMALSAISSRDDFQWYKTVFLFFMLADTTCYIPTYFIWLNKMTNVLEILSIQKAIQLFVIASHQESSKKALLAYFFQLYVEKLNILLFLK